MSSRLLLGLAATAVLLICLLPVSEAQARTCRGTVKESRPGTTIIADRMTAKKISCTSAKSLIRRFLRKQLRDIDCAGAASREGYACLIGSYECEKQGSRASCLDQGYGVTFRERDRSTG